MTTELTSRNWFGKASAGFILGLVIALGTSGVLSKVIGLQDTYFSMHGQFVMWMMSPVWCLVLSFCFLFRSGLRAWAILGVASGAIWALFLLLEVVL